MWYQESLEKPPDLRVFVHVPDGRNICNLSLFLNRARRSLTLIRPDNDNRAFGPDAQEFIGVAMSLVIALVVIIHLV